ncbi:hypothetical protein E8E11_003644 [Didymella keratinophila]|nr:hypothetical protein E8E11_003644 [Didymella keratinophila]
MDGLPRDKISMAKDLTDIIKSIAIVYFNEETGNSGWEPLLRAKGREKIIEAFEALWGHTQKMLMERFEIEPLKF